MEMQIDSNSRQGQLAQDLAKAFEAKKNDIRERLFEAVNGAITAPQSAETRAQGSDQALQQRVRRVIEDVKTIWQDSVRGLNNATEQEAQHVGDSEVQQELLDHSKKVQDFFEFTLIDQMNMMNCEVRMLAQAMQALPSQPDPGATEASEPGVQNEQEADSAIAKKLMVLTLKELFQEDLLSYRVLISNLDEGLLQECRFLGQDYKEDKIVGVQRSASSQPGRSESARISVPNLEYYKRSYRCFQTRNLYEQEKYNLLREQNEGYAKLIALLNQLEIQKLEQKAQSLNKSMQDVVNHFNLDPNRVIDIILESFEHHLGYVVKKIRSGGGDHRVKAHFVLDSPEINALQRIFMAMVNTWVPLQSTRENIVCALLGFKVQHLLNTMDFEQIDLSADPKDLIPYNLILLIALFIRDDVFQIEKIMPYFIQKKKVITEANPEPSAAPNSEAGQAQINSALAPSQPQKVEFTDKKPDDIVNYHERCKAHLNRVYSHIDVNFLDQRAKDKEKARLAVQKEELRNICRKQLPYNYQLWLLACLLQLNDLQDAEMLISTLWGDRKLDLTVHRDSLCTLLEALEVMISKLYAQTQGGNQPQKSSWYQRKRPIRDERTLNRTVKGIKVCETAHELVGNLQKLLKILGIYLGFNQVVFQKLLRVVHYHLLEKNDDKNLQAYAFHFAGEFFLPALCIREDQNQALDDMLWNIFSKMEFNRRYHYYYQLLSIGYLANSQLLERFTDLYPKAIQWTKQICDEQDRIQEEKHLAMKIGNGGNTLILAQQIIKVCTNYNNLIDPTIQSIDKALKDLALDMMAFVIIRHLSERQEVFKNIDSEGNLPLECTYFIKFTSLFFKTFQWVEIKPLFVYILNRLRDGNNTNEAFILSSILTSMSGWKDLEITLLNDKQLQCLAGGLKLKIDMMQMSAEFKKAKMRKYGGPATEDSQRRQLHHYKWSTADALLHLLYEVPQDSQDSQEVRFSLAFSLMANLAQQAHYVVDIMDCGEDMFLLQSIFDKTHQLFRQFVDTVYFLREDNLRFKQLIPPHDMCADLLAKEYQLPFQYSYYILRHSFKRLYDMSEEEFKINVDVYTKIFDQSFKSKLALYDEDKKAAEKMDCDEGNNDDEWDSYDEFPYFDEVKYLQNKFDKQMWTNFNKEVFTIFWQLELQDIQLPQQTYEEQIELKDFEIQRLQQSIGNNPAGSNGSGGGAGEKQIVERAEPPANKEQVKKAKKEIDNILRMKNDLSDELEQSQRTRYEKTLKFLKERLSGLFAEIEDEMGVSAFFTQYCLYPRLMFSPADAVYSIRFLKILVDLRVPKINVLNIFAQIMKAIIPTIHCCTTDESENLGVFFMEWFNLIERWTRDNGEVWKKECADYPGFSRRVGSSDLDSIINLDDYIKQIVMPIHERFSRFLIMYFRINPKTQFMKTKCALKILYRIRSVFPRDQAIAQQILGQVKRVVDMDKNVQQDILTLAQRYHQDLSYLIPKLPVLSRPQMPRPAASSQASGQANGKNSALPQAPEVNQQSQSKLAKQSEQPNSAASKTASKPAADSPPSNQEPTAHRVAQTQEANPMDQAHKLGQKRSHEEANPQKTVNNSNKEATDQAQDLKASDHDNHQKKREPKQEIENEEVNKRPRQMDSQSPRGHHKSPGRNQGNRKQSQNRSPRPSPNRMNRRTGGRQVSPRPSPNNKHQRSPRPSPNNNQQRHQQQLMDRERHEQERDKQNGRAQGGEPDQKPDRHRRDRRYAGTRDNSKREPNSDQRMNSRSQSPSRKQNRTDHIGNTDKESERDQHQGYNDNITYYNKRQQKQTAKEAENATKRQGYQHAQQKAGSQNASQEAFATQQEEKRLRQQRESRFSEQQQQAQKQVRIQPSGPERSNNQELQRGIGNKSPKHRDNGNNQNQKASPQHFKKSKSKSPTPPKGNNRGSQQQAQHNSQKRKGGNGQQAHEQKAYSQDSRGGSQVQPSSHAKHQSMRSNATSETPHFADKANQGSQRGLAAKRNVREVIDQYNQGSDHGGREPNSEMYGGQQPHSQQKKKETQGEGGGRQRQQQQQRQHSPSPQEHGGYTRQGMPGGKSGGPQGRRQPQMGGRAGGQMGDGPTQDSYRSHTVGKQQYHPGKGNFEFDADYEQHQGRAPGGSKTQQKRDYAQGYQGGPGSSGGPAQGYSSSHSQHQGGWTGGPNTIKKIKQDGGQSHNNQRGFGQGHHGHSSHGGSHRGGDSRGPNFKRDYK